MKYSLLIIVAFLAGCTAQKNTKNQAAMNETGIENIRWTLTEMGGKSIPSSVAGKVYILLSPEDRQVSGFTGCNRLMGSYESKKKLQLVFSKIATTRMACPGQGWDEFKFTRMLESATHYTIKGDQLSLNAGRRAPLAVFTKVKKEDISNKYWKLTKLDGKTVEMVDNQEREQYMILRSDGTAVGFAGCNQFSGNFSTEDGRKIKFSNMLSTLKACPDVALNESDFLKIFEAAEKYELAGEDQMTLLSGSGSTLAEFRAVYF